MDLRAQVRRVPRDRRHGERSHALKARQPDAPVRGLLGFLPADCVLDGEFVALDQSGRPVFADLLFGRRPPVFVAFNVLVDRGEDVRSLPLERRKAALKRLAKGARRWIAITDGVPGQGRRLFELVAEMDLEGIVAKHLADPYAARAHSNSSRLVDLTFDCGTFGHGPAAVTSARDPQGPSG